jgi:hypothetical protein
LRIVAESAPDLLNGEIESLLEIDKRFCAPDSLLDFFPCQQLARATGEQDKNLERLRRQVDERPALPQLHVPEVQFEDPEAQQPSFRSGESQKPPPQLSVVYAPAVCPGQTRFADYALSVAALRRGQARWVFRDLDAPFKLSENSDAVR